MKKVKCPVCKKEKPEDQYDWLPKQRKRYLAKCTKCLAKVIVNKKY